MPSKRNRITTRTCRQQGQGSHSTGWTGIQHWHCEGKLLW